MSARGPAGAMRVGPCENGGGQSDHTDGTPRASGNDDKRGISETGRAGERSIGGRIRLKGGLS
jgi:hypothetical protein